MRAKRLPLGLRKTKHNKLMKRLMIIALSLFVVFSQMSLSPFMGKASAEDGSTTPTTQFFDSVKLTTGEGDAAKDVNADNPLKKDDTVNLEYTWTQKDGQQFSSDQDVTIQIPNQFKVGTKDAEGKYTTDVTGEVKLADNTTVIGTYTAKASDGAADANKLTIHFDSDKTQNLANASGKLIIPVVFNDEVKADQKTDSVDFDLGNDQKQTVEIAVKAGAEQTETASSDSKAATSDASSSDSSKSSDVSSTSESKGSDSSSSKDASSADDSSVQANKDGSDEGQTSSGDASTSNVNSQQQGSNQLKSFSLFSAQTESASTPITALQPSSIKLVDPDNGDEEYTADYPATSESSVKIEYAWDVPESVRQTINKGDTLSFTLPNIFSIPSDQAPLKGELLDKGVDYGSFTVDANGNVVMTFSGEFQTHNNVSFGMYVTAQINKQNTGDSTTKTISFPINGETETATIYFKDGFSNPIQKKSLNFDSEHNPKEITWQIDVNLNKHELQNAQVVEDLESEGLTFDSVSVYPLSTNAVTGNIDSADTSQPLSKSASADGDNGKYAVDESTGTVTLGHITGAYRLIYKTKINNDQIPSDGGSKTFTNTATLKDDQILGSASADKKATYEKLITKSFLNPNSSTGQDPNNPQVTQWQIQYNYGEKMISSDDNSITDTFDTTKFFYDDIKVWKVTWDSGQDPSYTDVTSSFTPTSTLTGFTINFGGGSSAYLVTYDLKVKSGAVYIDKATSADNTATAGDGTKSETVKGSVDQQSLIKSHSNIDYQKKTVDWKIMVNEKNYPLNNWSIDDTFSYPLSNLTNLEIYTATPSTESNGAVTWSKGSDVTSDFNIGSTNSNGKPGFTIAPKSGSSYYNTTDTFMITYTTNFNGYTPANDSGNITTISNNSILDWYEITTNYPHETKTGDSYTPNPYTQTNGFKTHENYDPVNQNVLWKIYTNYNEEPLNNAYINDPIPSGMVFDSNVPVTVYKYDINSEGSVTNEIPIAQYNVSSDGTVTNGMPNSSDFTIIPPSSENNDTLKVDFSGVPANDTGHYMVSFATDLRGQVVEGNYTNNATFKNGSYPERTLKDTVKPTNGGQWLGKYGKQDGKYIKWNLEINKSLSVIDPGLVITDTSSSGQIVDQDSLEIYPAKVTNGVVQKDGSGHLVADTDKPLSASDYSVDVPAPDSTGKQIFTITFNKQISATAYVVSYKSLINISTSKGTLTNSAEFNGNNSQVIQDTNNKNTDVVNLSAGGWAVGTTGSLTVHKTGHTLLGNSLLKNVTFELWSEDASGNAETLLRTGTTGVNGNLTFSELVLGSGIKYILKEISTLDGYVINAPKEVNTGSLPNGNIINVVNNQNQLVVEKVVNDGDSAKGTQFKLYKKNLTSNYKLDSDIGDNGVFTINDENGQIIIAGLSQGDYYLQESKAPNGYLINDNKISFSVNQNNQIVNSTGSVITDQIEFRDYKGAVELTKVNQAGHPLKDAEFKVVNAQGDVQTGLISDKDGKVSAENLAPGDYKFVETKAPEGYVLNQQRIGFTIPEKVEGKPDPVKIEEQAVNYKGAVELTKVDQAGNPLKDAEFKVVNAQGDVQTGLISDKDGKVSAENLAPGDYKFVETKAPEGYLLNEHQIGFTIGDQANGKPGPVQIEEKAVNYKGSVELTKVDLSGHPLAGAEFKVVNAKGDVQTGLISDKDGKVSAENLAPGDYKFVETKAPEGYLLNEHQIGFTIGDQANGKPDPVQIEEKAVNYKGSVELTKVDSSGHPLAGAEFKVVNAKGDVQTGLVSDKDGKVSAENLAPGDYKFVETKAPEGYFLNEHQLGFTIGDQANGKPGPVQIEEKAVNYKGSVELTKVDSPGHPLAGAEFKIVNAQGDVQTGLISDKDGKVSAENLAPGDYKFVETKAPEGYLLNEHQIGFTIGDQANGKPGPVQIEEKAVNYKGSVELTKVDQAGNPLKDAEFKVVNAQGDVQTGLISDKDGKVSAENLAPGDYKFVETKAPQGYILNQYEIKFTILDKADGKPALVIIEEKAVNYTGKAQLLKTDQGGNGLNDAIFKITDLHENTILDNLKSVDGGIVYVSGLAPGMYHFVETQAPDGYILNLSEIEFEILAEANGIPSTVIIPGSFVNYKGSVELTKTGVNGSLPDAHFDLQKRNSDGTWETIKSNLTTLTEGKINVEDLSVGDYRFVEIQAPNGYLIHDPVTFSIDTSHAGIPDTQKISIQDDLNSVVLTKSDVNDKDAVLKGAEFKLVKRGTDEILEKDATGSELQRIWTTDDKGQFTVNGLAPGDYSFVETKAPDGYELDATPIPFEITNTDAQAKEITATDNLNTVVLTKVDKNDPDAVLKGAEFQLYDSNNQLVTKNIKGDKLSETWTTNDKGQFTIKGLPEGDYHFIETQAPNGYELDAMPIPFEVSNKDAKAIPVTATDKLNSAVLTKIDKNDPNAVLVGAEFKLVDKDGKIVETGVTGKKLPTTWTTDNKGQFTVNGLAPGDYNFIETKAPNGYELDATPIPVKVTNTDAKAIETDATDKLNSVVLTKVDKNDPDAVLVGAEFKLVDKDGKAVEKDATGKTLPKIWTTNDQGQFTVNGLAPGKYNFIETKAPNGYELDATPIPFEVTNKDVKAIPITATDKINSIVLTKVDKNDPDAVLAGAEFQLYDNTGKVVEKDANGKALSSVWTTNDKGQFTVNGLAPGNYHLIESKAPKNYDLDTTPIPFQVTATDVKAIPITATDVLTPGDVRLTKVDQNDPDAVLKGAVFKLTDSKGKTLKTGLTTDNSGHFVVKGLAPGKYFFIETKAPENYALDATPIPFVIEKGQAKAVEITATDKPLEVTRSLDGKPGATYNVVDENGHIIARGVMADEEGNVNFQGLATGKYHLVLVRGVEAETQKTKKAKAKETKGLPITGDTNDIMTMAAGAILLLGGGFLTIFSRRRRKN